MSGYRKLQPQNFSNFSNFSSPSPSILGTQNEGGIPAKLAKPAKVSSHARTLAVLASRCPDLVHVDGWRQAVADGRAFLNKWGEQASALGWTAKDLFGLFPVPAHAKPSFNRLSQYDATGLIWLLDGREVVALTEMTAAIQNPTGSITVYRRFNKPALGPVGDSLDDLDLSNQREGLTPMSDDQNPRA